jgi:hypothetical protein
MSATSALLRQSLPNYVRKTEAEKAATRAAVKARQEEMKAIMARHLAQKKAAGQ